MKNPTTKPLLLTCLCVMLFSLFSNAQCAAGLLANEEIKEGKKVILAQLWPGDESQVTYKHLLGTTLTVGKLGIANIGDCWFMGDITVNGEDVFFVGVTLKAAPGETYDGPVLATEAKAASDFPVGTKVIVHGIPITDPNSSLFYSDAPTTDTGYVTEADLTKNANGTYSGCILNGEEGSHFRTKKCFTEKKVEKRP